MTQRVHRVIAATLAAGAGLTIISSTAAVTTVATSVVRQATGVRWDHPAVATGVRWDATPNTGVRWDAAAAPNTGVRWDVASPNTGVRWDVVTPDTGVRWDGAAS